MTVPEAIRAIHEKGYCVLPRRLSPALLEACRESFWPTLLAYLDRHRDSPNRGPNRYFLPMPFDPPCFHPAFFFDEEVLAIVCGAMDDRVVADQWGCDVALPGAVHQNSHVDYQRPLFPEAPDLPLPIYMLVVSFGLVPITLANGPLEIIPGSHGLPREEAFRAAAHTNPHPIPLELGDVLLRHPWALHRGSPNRTDTPRPLVTIRYVRRWYADGSREVNPIPRSVWESLTPEQRSALRFPIAG